MASTFARGPAPSIRRLMVLAVALCLPAVPPAIAGDRVSEEQPKHAASGRAAKAISAERSRIPAVGGLLRAQSADAAVAAAAREAHATRLAEVEKDVKSRKIEEDRIPELRRYQEALRRAETASVGETHRFRPDRFAAVRKGVSADVLNYHVFTHERVFPVEGPGGEGFAKETFRAPYSSPYTSTSSWAYETGDDWHIWTTPAVDANAGTLDDFTEAHHVFGTSTVVGGVAQRVAVPAGAKTVRVVADVSLSYTLFAWSGNEPYISSSDGDFYMVLSDGDSWKSCYGWEADVWTSGNSHQVSGQQSFKFECESALARQELEIRVLGGVTLWCHGKDNTGAGGEVVATVKQLDVEWK